MLMSNNHWIDVPEGFNEAHVNPQNGIYIRDNVEDMTPSSSDNAPRLNDSYSQEDGRSHVYDGNAGKKKVSRIIGWGLRRFSTIVCRKVQAKGRTTYNEVADEIIAELSSGEQFDEKNIRRRVYDAFNVLIAIDVIAKDKKEISWTGFPLTRTEQAKQLEGVQKNLVSRIRAKENYLKELEHQLVDLQELMLRNQKSHKSGNVSSDGVHLPFVLVQTHPKATVEIEISEDMQLVHFDFNETPYSLYDEHAVLKMMRCPRAGDREQASGSMRNESLITDQCGRLLKPAYFSWNSENMNMKNTENVKAENMRAID